MFRVSSCSRSGLWANIVESLFSSLQPPHQSPKLPQLDERHFREKISLSLNKRYVVPHGSNSVAIDLRNSSQTENNEFQVVEDVNNEKMELICATLMFLFIDLFQEASPKFSPSGKQVVEPLGERMSRIGMELEQIHHGQLCPRKIDYDTIKKHLDTGGSASAFRGTTVSQSTDLSNPYSRSSARVYFIPITTHGISCLALKDFFEEQKTSPDFQKLLSSIGFDYVPEIFGEEAETIVPRPLRIWNITRIEFFGEDGSLRKVYPPPASKGQSATYKLAKWEAWFKILSEKNCLNKR